MAERVDTGGLILFSFIRATGKSRAADLVKTRALAIMVANVGWHLCRPPSLYLYPLSGQSDSSDNLSGSRPDDRLICGLYKENWIALNLPPFAVANNNHSGKETRLAWVLTNN